MAASAVLTISLGLTLTRCGFQVGARRFLFVLSLLQVHQGDSVMSGKLVDGLYVLLADFAKCGRRGNWEFSLPAQEGAYVPDGLELGRISLEEDSIDATAAERHMIPE